MTHIQLLKTNQTVRILSTVQLINYFALMFTQVALFTLLAQNGASALEMGFAAAIFWMPSIIISPFSGVAADRFSPNILLPTLLIIEVLATISFLGATDKEDFYLLLSLLFLRSSAGVMYYTTTMALFPKILDNESLKKANEIHSIIYSFCLTSGMALGGIIVAYFGVIEAFLIDAGLYIIGILTLLRAKLPYIKEKQEAVLAMLKDGAKYLLSAKDILFLIAMHAVVATTLFDAIVTLLAKNRYAELLAIPLAIGFVNAIRSLSAVIGPLIIGKYANKDSIGYFILLESFALFGWSFLANNFYTSLFGAFLSGILLTTIWSYTMTMIQERVKPEYFGRVIAYNDMFFTFIATLTSVCIGAILEWGVDERYGIAIIGALFFSVAIFYIKYKDYFLKN